MFSLRRQSRGIQLRDSKLQTRCKRGDFLRVLVSSQEVLQSSSVREAFPNPEWLPADVNHSAKGTREYEESQEVVAICESDRRRFLRCYRWCRTAWQRRVEVGLRERLAGVFCIVIEVRNCVVMYHVRSAAEVGELRRDNMVLVLLHS